MSLKWVFADSPIGILNFQDESVRISQLVSSKFDMLHTIRRKKKNKKEIKTREMTRAISARAESTILRATADSFAKLKYARVSGSCNQSLGMESGDIPDSAITASSSYVTNVGPRNGRWVHYFYDIPFSTTLSFDKTEREIEGKEIQKESEKEIEKEKEKAEREGGKQTDTLH